MTIRRDASAPFAGKISPPELSPPIFIATLLREEGTTGVQTHFGEVISYLTAQGNPPRIVTPWSSIRAIAFLVFGPRVPLDRLSGTAGVVWYRFWHFHFLRRALRHELRSVEGAIIYAQCPLSARAALEARRGSFQQVVIAVHFEGSQADEWVDAGKIRRDGIVYRAIRETERRVVPKVDRILYVSAAAKRELERYVPAAAAVPAAVIPNFISSPIAVAEGAPSADRAADLVNIGGLLRIKNQKFLLEVLAQANQLGRHYTLDLIGEGPLGQSLSELAESLGVRDQVRFLGRRDDARTLLPNHRVYVHASTREGLCISMIEAMAAGLPIVTSPTKGVLELFEPGVQGLLWSLEEPEAAAQLLIELMEDDDRVAEMSKAARERFAAAFDVAVVGPIMEQFLVAQPAPAGHTSNGQSPSRSVP